jgi:hypothetical protein
VFLLCTTDSLSSSCLLSLWKHCGVGNDMGFYCCKQSSKVENVSVCIVTVGNRDLISELQNLNWVTQVNTNYSNMCYEYFVHKYLSSRSRMSLLVSQNWVQYYFYSFKLPTLNQDCQCLNLIKVQGNRKDFITNSHTYILCQNHYHSWDSLVVSTLRSYVHHLSPMNFELLHFLYVNVRSWAYI